MKKNPTHPAKVNLKHIKSFLQGYTRKFSEAFGLLPEYKQEQVIWRSEFAKECTENKSCICCGCDTPAKYYSDDACDCEDPNVKCYPGMMDEETWEKYKKDNSIVVKISDDTV